MTELAWLFPYLLFLHILGAIAGFGPSFAFPIVGAMGGKEREHGNFATRVSEAISGRLVWALSGLAFAAFYWRRNAGSKGTANALCAGVLAFA